MIKTTLITPQKTLNTDNKLDSNYQEPPKQIPTNDYSRFLSNPKRMLHMMPQKASSYFKN
jgi:hypothetical protein